MTATPRSTSRLPRGRRSAAALTVSALVSALLGVTAAGPAQAADCTPATGTKASVRSVKVAPLYIRGTRADYSIPVTVSVCDPADLVKSGEAFLDVTPFDPAASIYPDGDNNTAPPAGSGDVKTYSFTLHSIYVQHLYGSLDVAAEIYGASVSPNDDNFLDGMIARTAVKSRTYLTNTPSVTTVKRGGTTVIRGVLRRFDGAPLANQRVAIKVIPAGWTRGSFAGYARTTSTGAFALTVRAYYPGSWYANYAGDSTAISSYKAAWVRVIS